MDDSSGGDKRVLAAAHQILRSFGGSRKVKDDMISILSNYNDRFSSISEFSSEEAVKKQLTAMEDTACGWESNHSANCASYSYVADDMLKLIEDLSSLSPADSAEEYRNRAENVLQMAMSRLEDELKQRLLNNATPLHALHGLMDQLQISFALEDCEAENVDERILACTHEGRSMRELEIDLIESEAIHDIREIAGRMISAGYEKECCIVYVAARHAFLNDFLQEFGVEKMSIEETQKTEWAVLDKKMSNWSQSIMVLTKVVFPAERRLCDKIFENSSEVGNICFVESIKESLGQLMTFADAILAGERSTERLFRILDMYSSLSGVITLLEEFFHHSEMVVDDARDILVTLAGTVKGTLTDFEIAIQNDIARKSMQGAEIYPLTRYVMNYINLLVDYRSSLNSILGSDLQKDHEEKQESRCHGDRSPLAHRLLIILSHLESNLGEKANLYSDKAMQFIFLMNNLLYVVQIVKNSELRNLLGDIWIRKHRGLIRQYSTNYLRASWTKLLACLKDEGISGTSNSSNANKIVLKEKFKRFNHNFEEIYKEQTSWKVPDLQLREELRISVSEKLIPAYRSFLGRFRGLIENGRHPWKYIKYSSEDLENFLLDFFEGNPGKMTLSKRR